MFSLSLSETKQLYFSGTMTKIFVIIVLGLITTSCTSTQTPKSTATPIPTLTPTPSVRGWEMTATVASRRAREAGGIRFMTYNIHGGGGFYEIGGSENRNLILSIIKTYNPDVIGLQEADGFQRDNYSIIKHFAEELGMNYSYVKCGADGDEFTHDTIILTKFEIVDTENFHNKINVCMGRVEILLPDGQTIQVFNLHIPYQYCHKSFPLVVEVSLPYMNSPAVMMGDFNVVDPDYYRSGENFANSMVGCPEILEDANWTWLKGELFTGSIDQVWVSPPLQGYDYITMIHRKEYLADTMDINSVSDHSPVAADIYFP